MLYDENVYYFDIFQFLETVKYSTCLNGKKDGCCSPAHNLVLDDIGKIQRMPSLQITF